MPMSFIYLLNDDTLSSNFYFQMNDGINIDVAGRFVLTSIEHSVDLFLFNTSQNNVTLYIDVIKIIK